MPTKECRDAETWCAACRCKSCWDRLGFDARRCWSCERSRCPEDGPSEDCTSWLLSAIRAGRVRLVSESDDAA